MKNEGTMWRNLHDRISGVINRSRGRPGLVRLPFLVQLFSQPLAQNFSHKFTYFKCSKQYLQLLQETTSDYKQ